MDLPRYGQWLQCLKDILAVNYDNREAISVRQVEGQDNSSSGFEITGKGFSRVSALAFTLWHGSQALDGLADGLSAEEVSEAKEMFNRSFGLVQYIFPT